MNSSDHQILLKIRSICNEISIFAGQRGFDINKVMINFNNISLFSMYLLQIGSLSTSLSGEFKNQYPHILWDDLIEISNKIFTDFFSINIPNIWELGKKSVPELNILCKELLGDEQFSYKPVLH
ncbi:MAG: hypothetical protein LBF58_08285 [Deltaproteobacteria bacterium]|jgi:uncharacterized protein with HEPN domain|nr:hypothetical protein [Deltaproteobacteria bacterium]